MNAFDSRMELFMQRFHSRRSNEAGLALLDVLLGMAIFALIAVIAVQSMGQFRQRAHVTRVTSDLKQVELAVAAAMTEPGADRWDPMPAAMRNAYNTNPFWGSNSSAVMTNSLMTPADLTRLGINLSSPTTQVRVHYTDSVAFDLISAFADAGFFTDVASTNHEAVAICVHDTATNTTAWQREATTVNYKGSGTPASAVLSASPLTAITSGPCPDLTSAVMP